MSAELFYQLAEEFYEKEIKGSLELDYLSPSELKALTKLAFIRGVSVAIAECKKMATTITEKGKT